jgi:hypothetical protein
MAIRLIGRALDSNGNQWQSMAINGNQWQSMAIRLIGRALDSNGTEQLECGPAELT